MTPKQCRDARELLGWTEMDLAKHAGIQVTTVRYVEGPHGRPKDRTLAIIRANLEAAGVEFVSEPNECACVSLRNKPHDTRAVHGGSAGHQP